MSETKQFQAEDSNPQQYHSLINQSPGLSNIRSLSSVRANLETMILEETDHLIRLSEMNNKPSSRVTKAIEEGSVQSNPYLIRSNTDESVRISLGPSNDQLRNNALPL
ncbi:hypothetical protein ACTFIW_008738 [Dictyostelium discoideum]